MINLLRIVSHVCLNGSESIRASISEITWYQNIFLPFLLTIKNPNYKTTCKNIMELSPEDIRETSDIHYFFGIYSSLKNILNTKWRRDTLVMRECYYILVHTVTLGQTQWQKLPVRWEIWSSHWVCRMFQIWQILGIGIWRFFWVFKGQCHWLSGKVIVNLETLLRIKINLETRLSPKKKLIWKHRY